MFQYDQNDVYLCKRVTKNTMLKSTESASCPAQDVQEMEENIVIGFSLCHRERGGIHTQYIYVDMLVLVLMYHIYHESLGCHVNIFKNLICGLP